MSSERVSDVNVSGIRWYKHELREYGWCEYAWFDDKLREPEHDRARHEMTGHVTSQPLGRCVRTQRCEMWGKSIKTHRRSDETASKHHENLSRTTLKDYLKGYLKGGSSVKSVVKTFSPNWKTSFQVSRSAFGIEVSARPSTKAMWLPKNCSSMAIQSTLMHRSPATATSYLFDSKKSCFKRR